MNKKQESVLVTGADGFIGSHLTELLVKEGHKVKALSQYNSFNYWGWLEDIECRDQIEVLNGDVRDPHYWLTPISRARSISARRRWRMASNA
jgi:nucleoside-diphosphate-sugar epimerase